MHPKQYAQLLYEVLENKSDEEQAQIFDRFRAMLIKNKYTHNIITKHLNDNN